MVNTRASLKREFNGEPQQQIVPFTLPNYPPNPHNQKWSFGYKRRCDVKKVETYDLQLCEEVDYIQVAYPTDKKSDSRQTEDSNATSLNLSDMLALEEDFSSVDSKKIDPLVTVSGYRVKPDAASILSGILAKHGDIAVNCNKSVEFRSLLLENVCEVVRKLEATEFVSITAGEIDSFKNLLIDMESDVNVGWLLQRLDEITDAKRLLRECSAVKQAKTQTESEIRGLEDEIRKLQEMIKCVRKGIELKRREKMEFEKVLSYTKIQLKKFHCEKNMTHGLI